MTVTVPEAAKRAGKNPETIRRWIREGRLPAHKVGTQHMIDEQDLQALVGDDVLPAPKWWNPTATGESMPDWVAILRRQRAGNPIEAGARLRTKNQLTLPEPIAQALGAAPNDVLVFEIDPTQPDLALVHLVRAGFAGALTGTYGTTDDVKAFIRQEHAAWGE